MREIQVEEGSIGIDNVVENWRVFWDMGRLRSDIKVTAFGVHCESQIPRLMR